MIRAYQDGDAASVRGLIVELQDFERGIDPRLSPGSEMAAAYFDDMLSQCHRHGGQIFVAEVSADVVGFVTILARVPFEALDDPPGEFAYISDLAVASQHRGEGLGTALLVEAERFANASGARELRINALYRNEAALALYRRFGFIPYLATLAKRLPAQRPDEAL